MAVGAWPEAERDLQVAASLMRCPWLQRPVMTGPAFDHLHGFRPQFLHSEIRWNLEACWHLRPQCTNLQPRTSQQSRGDDGIEGQERRECVRECTASERRHDGARAR